MSLDTYSPPPLSSGRRGAYGYDDIRDWIHRGQAALKQNSPQSGEDNPYSTRARKAGTKSVAGRQSIAGGARRRTTSIATSSSSKRVSNKASGQNSRSANDTKQGRMRGRGSQSRQSKASAVEDGQRVQSNPSFSPSARSAHSTQSMSPSAPSSAYFHHFADFPDQYRFPTDADRSHLTASPTFSFNTANGAGPLSTTSNSTFSSSPMEATPPNFAFLTPLPMQSLGSMQSEVTSVPAPALPFAAASAAGSITTSDDSVDASQTLLHPTSPSTRPATASSSSSALPIRGGRKKNTSHARKREDGHIKRPPNAFIMFRSHAYTNNLIPRDLEVTDHRDVSRIVAHMWNNLPTDERNEWVEEARKAKLLHQARHPDYKFKPDASHRIKLTRNVKQSDNALEKCETIADNILKSYGRQGVVVKPASGRMAKSSSSEPSSSGEGTSSAKSTTPNPKPRTRAPSSSSKRPSTPRKKRSSRTRKATSPVAAIKITESAPSAPDQPPSRPRARRVVSERSPAQTGATRGRKGKSKEVSDQPSAAEPSGQILNPPQTSLSSEASIEDYMASAALLHHGRSASLPPVSSHVEPFEDVMTILAAAQTQSTVSSEVQQPATPLLDSQSADVGLLMEWTEKLSEDAGFAVGSNVFSNPFNQTHQALARAFSETNILQAPHGVGHPQQDLEQSHGGERQDARASAPSRERVKKRPERLALTSSSIQGVSFFSPRSHSFDLTLGTPVTSQEIGGPMSDRSHDNSENTFGPHLQQERPKTTSLAMRHGESNFNEDAMLVSPMYASFADMRRFSVAMANWQATQGRRRSRVLPPQSAADTNFPSSALFNSRTSFSSSGGFGGINSAGFPMTPGTARFDLHQQALHQSRRNSLALDGSGMGPLNLSPRAMIMDLDHQSISDSILAHPPPTPLSSTARTHDHSPSLTSHRRQTSMQSSGGLPIMAPRGSLAETDSSEMQTIEEVQRGMERLDALHLSPKSNESSLPAQQEQGSQMTRMSQPTAGRYLQSPARAAMPTMEARVAYGASPNSIEENAKQKSIAARYASDPRTDLNAYYGSTGQGRGEKQNSLGVDRGIASIAHLRH